MFMVHQVQSIFVYVARDLSMFLASKQLLKSSSLRTHQRDALELAREHLESHQSDFDILIRLNDQLGPDPIEFSYEEFDCSEYEKFLRSMRNVGQLLHMEGMEFITELLQHEEFVNPGIDPAQLAWQRTAYDLLHWKNYEFYVEKFSARLSKFSSLPYKFNCHNQQH